MKLEAYKTTFERAKIPFAPGFFEALKDCEPATLFRVVRWVLLRYLPADEESAKLMIDYYRAFRPDDPPDVKLLAKERSAKDIIFIIVDGFMPVSVDKRSHAETLLSISRRSNPPLSYDRIGGTR